jgi:UDP-N-acetylmuramyl pentapeptide phosphotransferase/UDP-N-acetylglucosamine-1-phosphate transferase
MNPVPASAALVTLVTALALTIVCIPALRIVLHSLRLDTLWSLRRGSALAAGGLGVFLAVTLLLPMGGDGLVIPWSDAQVGVVLLLAAGLLVAGTRESWVQVPWKQRWLLQVVFAIAAAHSGARLGGCHSRLVAEVAGVAVLLVATHAITLLDTLDGLAAGCGAILASCLGVAAVCVNAPEWSDLALGLTGALVALLGFDLGAHRFKTQLGPGGARCVGFLFGATLLHLSQFLPPETRPSLALPLALPLLEAMVRCAHALWPRSAAHLSSALAAAGITHLKILILLWTATALSGLAMLRFTNLL